jgi:hypothetical protein
MMTQARHMQENIYDMSDEIALEIGHLKKEIAHAMRTNANGHEYGDWKIFLVLSPLFCYAPCLFYDCVCYLFYALFL